MSVFAQPPREWFASRETGQEVRGGCWGVTVGQGWCQNCPEDGLLTCRRHRHCEDAAQRMLRDIAAEDSERLRWSEIDGANCGEMVVLWAGTWHLAMVEPRKVLSACGAIWVHGLMPAKFEFRRSAAGIAMCRMCANNQKSFFGRIVYRPWEIFERQRGKEVDDGYA